MQTRQSTDDHYRCRRRLRLSHLERGTACEFHFVAFVLVQFNNEITSDSKNQNTHTKTSIWLEIEWFFFKKLIFIERILCMELQFPEILTMQCIVCTHHLFHVSLSKLIAFNKITECVSENMAN